VHVVFIVGRSRQSRSRRPLHDAALDPPRHHRAATRDRKHVLHRHQERPVNRPLRRRDVSCPAHRPAHDRLLAQLALSPSSASLAEPLRSECRRPGSHTCPAAPHFHLDELQQLASSTMSTLFSTPRCTAHPPAAPSKMCSRVCGIGPSAALTPGSPVHRVWCHVLHIVRGPGQSTCA